MDYRNAEGALGSTCPNGSIYFLGSELVPSHSYLSHGETK